MIDCLEYFRGVALLYATSEYLLEHLGLGLGTCVSLLQITFHSSVVEFSAYGFIVFRFIEANFV